MTSETLNEMFPGLVFQQDDGAFLRDSVRSELKLGEDPRVVPIAQMKPGDIWSRSRAR